MFVVAPMMQRISIVTGKHNGNTMDSEGQRTVKTREHSSSQTGMFSCFNGFRVRHRRGGAPKRLGAFLAGKALEEWGAVWQGKALRGLPPA